MQRREFVRTRSQARLIRLIIQDKQPRAPIGNQIQCIAGRMRVGSGRERAKLCHAESAERRRVWQQIEMPHPRGRMLLGILDIWTERRREWAIQRRKLGGEHQRFLSFGNATASPHAFVRTDTVCADSTAYQPLGFASRRQSETVSRQQCDAVVGYSGNRGKRRMLRASESSGPVFQPVLNFLSM